MKINPNNKTFKPELPKQLQKDENQGAKGFDSILKETIGNTGGASGVNPAPAIGNISSIQLNQLPASEIKPVIEQTAKLLEKLEAYQQKLKSPVPLKEIYPLIQDLEVKHADLAPSLNRLPDGDGLKDIVNDALTTVSIEAIKFRRGDYI